MSRKGTFASLPETRTTAALPSGAVGEDADLVGLHGLPREHDERLVVLRHAGRAAVVADRLEGEDVAAERVVAVALAFRFDVDCNLVVREDEVVHAHLVARVLGLDDLRGVVDATGARLPRGLRAEGVAGAVAAVREAEGLEIALADGRGRVGSLPDEDPSVGGASENGCADDDGRCEEQPAKLHDSECYTLRGNSPQAAVEEEGRWR